MPDRTKALLSIFACAFAAAASAQPCGDAAGGIVDGQIDFTRVLRASVPPGLFGFNVPWRDFQIGFWRDGRVRQELVDLMRPFKGAVYRYPGGSPSNTFDWEASRGPIERRTPVHADYGRRAKVEFGPDEFARFLGEVDGIGLLTANLTGLDEKEASPSSDVPAAARQFLKQAKEAFGLPCRTGTICRVQAIELGNELDWPPYRMEGGEYGARARAFRDEIARDLPGLDWVLAGKTAPWESLAYRNFNRAALERAGAGFDGIAIHPYYDGLPVPTALNYVSEYADALKRLVPKGSVYITEHARWPAKPADGPWERNWYTTTNMGGALASADFLLGLMPLDSVKVANWHALSAAGPWQLVRLAPDRTTLIPTALYWSLRVLREGLLDELVSIAYAPTKLSRYRGGYDQRLVALKSGYRVSVLGVNRAATPISLRLRTVGLPTGLTGRLVWVGSQSQDDQNSAEARDAIRPQSRTVVPAGSDLSVCLPPNAVFAVQLAR